MSNTLTCQATPRISELNWKEASMRKSRQKPAAMAKAKTQPENSLTVEESMEVETAKMAGHTVKRMAVATSEDGGRAGRTILVDDYENPVFEGKAHGRE